MGGAVNKLICLIENDLNLAKMIERRLSLIGFEICHYPSGEEYLEKHPSGLPALYMIELNLPGMNGKDLVKRIRLTSSLVPIHIISPDPESGEIIQALKAGADDYLIKPFDMNEFTARVNVAWNKYSLLNERKITLSTDTSR